MSTSTKLSKTLSPTELGEIWRFLQGKTHLEEEDMPLVTALEETAVSSSRSAAFEVTKAAISLYLLRESSAYLSRKDEFGDFFLSWKEYMAYLERRGLCRSTVYKHLATLRLWHGGLGRAPEEAFEFGGVRLLDGMKRDLVFDRKTGEIVAAKRAKLLENLPWPDEEDEPTLADRYNAALDELQAGSPVIELTSSGIVVETGSPTGSDAEKTMREQGGQPIVRFFWAAGPMGSALGWYYSEDNVAYKRGLVGIHPMPPLVQATLKDMVNAPPEVDDSFEPIYCKCGERIHAQEEICTTK